MQHTLCHGSRGQGNRIGALCHLPAQSRCGRRTRGDKGWPAGPGVPALGAGRAALRGKEPGLGGTPQRGQSGQGARGSRGARFTSLGRNMRGWPGAGCAGPAAPGRRGLAWGARHPWVRGCPGEQGGARSRCPVSVHRGGPGRGGGGSAESAAANAQAEAGGGSGAGPGRAGGAAAAMGLLNFTREPVPEAVSGDMHNLNQLSAEVRGRPGGRARRGHGTRPGPHPRGGATGNGPRSSPGAGPERAPALTRHSPATACAQGAGGDGGARVTHSTHRRVLVLSSTDFSCWGCAGLGCLGQRQHWWQQQREGGGLCSSPGCECGG